MHKTQVSSSLFLYYIFLYYIFLFSVSTIVTYTLDPPWCHFEQDDKKRNPNKVQQAVIWSVFSNTTGNTSHPKTQSTIDYSQKNIIYRLMNVFVYRGLTCKRHQFFKNLCQRKNSFWLVSYFKLMQMKLLGMWCGTWRCHFWNKAIAANGSRVFMEI